MLRPTRHNIDHSGDIIQSHSLGSVPKKLNLTQRKQTTQEQNGNKNMQSEPKTVNFKIML